MVNYKKKQTKIKKVYKNTENSKKYKKISLYFIIDLIIEKIKLFSYYWWKLPVFYNTFKTLTNW